MPGRIRTIKPEILEDELASLLTDTAWRVWVSMWTIADDHGNVRANHRYLAAQVWQDTTRLDDIADALLELSTKIATPGQRPMISLYSVEGQQYAHIKGFPKHQRMDNAGKGRVPKPPDGDSGTNIQQLARSFSANRGESPQPAVGREAASEFAASRACAPPRSPTTTTTTTTERSGSDEPAPPSSRSDAPAQQTLLADDAPASDPEREVYEHYLTGWRQVIHGNRPPKFSPERRRKVRARLAEKWSVADLKLAVDGLWCSQWHIDEGQTDLELVCRDTKHVEQFLDKLPRDQRHGSASVSAEQEQHTDPADSEADMIARTEQLERDRQAMREAKRRNGNG